jgi:predicted metalloprotease with PDZ domain
MGGRDGRAAPIRPLSGLTVVSRLDGSAGARHSPVHMHDRPKWAGGLKPCLLPLLFLSATPAVHAQNQPPPTRSAPAAEPVAASLPEPRDVAWPGGTMHLEVDATDVGRRIIRVKQTIPLASGGPLTLLLPQWLPGHHGPRGEIDKLAGLRFTADGQEARWTRDAVNVYAFHLQLPASAKSLVAEFQYLAATEPNQGRVKVSDNILNLQWENLSLYPAGYYVRRVPVQASVTYPAGWTDATALRGTRAGARVAYEATDYETLIDSPVFAGRIHKAVALGSNVSLQIFADDAKELAATPDQIDKHKRLVVEAIALFGGRHFDRYDFLLALSDQFGGIGLEHHRSSENAVAPGYFIRWSEGPGDRNLLPHEIVHSWNGKFRRPAALWTPDYATPMRDDLLWVYEGQTQFWGYVLGARSGIFTKDQTLDALATIAAHLDATRGRTWRPVADTTRDPIISARRPKGWTDWQRNEDYYNEGLMIWLEADAIIRRGTGGKRGMDDFARAFFGMNDGDWGVLTYARADVVKALNDVMPYDWDGFLTARVDRTSPEVTKAGLELGGYRLTYGTEPNSVTKARETDRHIVDQSSGVGLVVKDDGAVDAVIWDSPAFRAGMTSGDQIVAVGGIEYSRARFLEGLGATSSAKTPLQLIVKQRRRFTTITLDYSGGIRYPRLQKTGEGETSLDRLLKPRR